jgi:nudix-type nucleoside diphosphatase (YffH/AdpP family)
MNCPPTEATMSVEDRVRIRQTKLLSDNHYVLRRVTYDWRRADGAWQSQTRESYDRGNGAALLAYDPVRGTVILVRQFRYPAFANGYEDLLIEAPAGLLDDAEPEARIRAEVEEEAGYRLGEITRVFHAFMSPGAVTERISLFVAPYDPSMKVGDGGGHPEESEDIEVLELGFDEAMAMVADGRICDAKTIMLLQWAALNVFGM